MEKTPADVLEEAADLLLIRGRLRDGSLGNVGGPRCVLGAISEIVGCEVGDFGSPQYRAFDAASRPLYHAVEPRMVGVWNDSTDDDFEVIDTLRAVAKNLRNEAS